MTKNLLKWNAPVKHFFIFIKPKSKYKHFKSNSHKDCERCKHVEKSIENPNKNDVDRIFCSYIIEHEKSTIIFPIKCQFKIILKDYQYCPNVTFKLYDNKTRFSWSNFSEKVLSDFEDKGNNFNHIAEMNNITIANKLDMSYDFYIRHNMHGVEWNVKALIIKNKNLINKLINNSKIRIM